MNKKIFYICAGNETDVFRMQKDTFSLIAGIRTLLIFFSVFLFMPVTSYASKEHDSQKQSHNEVFKPGEMIVDHIVDAHDWHILSIGNTHISIPLPVILIDRGKLHVFLSSKFHHGHSDFKSFRLMLEGKHKGKIVRLDENAEIIESSPYPFDLSITKTVAGIFISILVMLLMLFPVAKRYKTDSIRPPKGLQTAIEFLVVFIRDEIARPSIGHNYKRFMPYLLTLFFFIFFSNLIGLIPFFPGGANVTGNISITLTLALFTFIVTNFSGRKNYWKHIFNAPGVPWWLKAPIPLLPIIEMLGMFIKPFVLMVRLFANITAGHIIILGFMSLIFIFGQISSGVALGVAPVSVVFSIFITVLELLVAFIQAYVFTLLSALYFGMAVEEHH
jgi:F-type H+-transporting ATPase subunit a